jgi:hypothetical protein
MNRRQKTAAHLERMVLTEIRRYALCSGVSAVTVRETADGTSWEVAELYGPGGTVPPACREIGLAAAAELRKDYDLLPESELVPDDDLRLQ